MQLWGWVTSVKEPILTFADFKQDVDKKLQGTRLCSLCLPGVGALSLTIQVQNTMFFNAVVDIIRHGPTNSEGEGRQRDDTVLREAETLGVDEFTDSRFGI